MTKDNVLHLYYHKFISNMYFQDVAKYEKLVQGLKAHYESHNAKGQAKGKPLEKLDKNRPKKSDRIGIIGAGPSGLHMAYQLKRAGFENVVVVEKTGRIGGKSKAVTLDGVPHALSTYIVSDDHEQIFKVRDER